MGEACGTSFCRKFFVSMVPGILFEWRDSMRYEEAMAFLEEANRQAGEMGIEAIRRLLNEMNNPQEQLSIVHVGGTNGKGSVSAYISYVLAAAGYKVGRYVSPTIREYRERIQTLRWENGEPKAEYIAERDLVQELDAIRKIYQGMQQQGSQLPSAFEIETALGFSYFRKCNCDIVLLEVGLGGRLDATNVITKSECTVLTSISRDHMQILGNDLHGIAREKAGIIKPKGTVVAYDYKHWSKERGEEDLISGEIVKVCRLQEATITFADFGEIAKVKHTMEGITFDYKEWENLKVSLLGEHQIKNAVVALETIEVMRQQGWKIREENVRVGLQKTRWNGRFEVLQRNPYYILDGAHNEDGARNLARSLERYLKGKKIIGIAGILADKEYEKIMAQIGPKLEHLFVITPGNPRALPAEQLKEVAGKNCSQVEVCKTVEQAMERAEKEKNEFDAVVIFGSLYFQKDVYAYLEKEK